MSLVFATLATGRGESGYDSAVRAFSSAEINPSDARSSSDELMTLMAVSTLKSTLVPTNIPKKKKKSSLSYKAKYSVDKSAPPPSGGVSAGGSVP